MFSDSDSEESDLFFEDSITFRDANFERTFPGQLNEFHRTGKCIGLDLVCKTHCHVNPLVNSL